MIARCAQKTHTFYKLSGKPRLKIPVCFKDTHILQVIWQVKAQNSNFASKTENRVEHRDLQRGCGLDQKVKRFERGKMLRDAKQF